MSVPKSERHESSVAYLYNATVFGSKSMKLLSQMSKKWKTYNLDYYSSLIHGIIETLATANAIYPKDEQEYRTKKFLLQKGKGLSDAMQILINDLLEEWTSANTLWNSFSQEKKTNAIKPKILEIKENSIIEVAALCEELNNSITSAITKVNKKI